MERSASIIYHRLMSEGGKNSMRYKPLSLMILAAGIQPALADVRKPTCDDLFSFVDAMPGMHKTFSQSELERLLGTGPLKMSVGDFDQTIGIVWNCRLLAEKSAPQDPLGAARSSKLMDLYSFGEES